jgi:hypothetical protein
MKRPPSSTALAEGSRQRRGILVTDADTSVVVADVGRVPLSSQTDTALPQLQAYEAVRAQGIVGAIGPTGPITGWPPTNAGHFTVSSPTLRLATQAFQPIALHAESIATAWNEFSLIVRMLDLAAAAQPFSAAPGLFNSTDAVLGISRTVESKLAGVFAEARHAWFEDGVESEFSRALSMLIHTYGDAVVSAAETLLSSRSTNIEVAIEAAHTLGEVDHPASLRYRRSLLEKLLLTAPSVRRRQGAAAGLASMDDPSSLVAVTQAFDRESNQRFRQYLQLVMDQLERTRACHSS